jgi:hypothetical protein
MQLILDIENEIIGLEFVGSGDCNQCRPPAVDGFVSRNRSSHRRLKAIERYLALPSKLKGTQQYPWCVEDPNHPHTNHM